MKTLREYNREKLLKWESKNMPVPNQIACPECGAELLDSSPQVLLTNERGFPPRKKVHCPACGARDTRIA